MEPLSYRRLETFLCEKLRVLVPGHQILPFSGGDSKGDAFEVEPPLCVIAVTKGEKTHQQENTWICEGSLQWITHMDEATPQEHEAAVRILVANLQTIAGVQETYFTFHGLDIGDEKMSQSEDGSHRASIVSFTAGCSG